MIYVVIRGDYESLHNSLVTDDYDMILDEILAAYNYRDRPEEEKCGSFDAFAELEIWSGGKILGQYGDLAYDKINSGLKLTKEELDSEIQHRIKMYTEGRNKQ